MCSSCSQWETEKGKCDIIRARRSRLTSWCDWCSVLSVSIMLAVWCCYRNVTHPELRHVSEGVAVDTPTAVHKHVHTHASMIGVISTHFPHSRHGGGGEKECGFTLSSSSLKSNLSLSRSSWTRRAFKGGRQSARRHTQPAQRSCPAARVTEDHQCWVVTHIITHQQVTLTLGRCPHLLPDTRVPLIFLPTKSQKNMLTC